MAIDPAVIEALAEEILTDIELSRVKLSVVMLKCSRLARLLGDSENQQVFKFEASGYPSSPDGVPQDAFELARKVGRIYVVDKKVEKETVRTEQMNTSSVESLEEQVEAKKIALTAAADRDVSVASANPSQYVMAPVGNAKERTRIQNDIADLTKRISVSRSYAHEYVTAVLYQSRFSETATSIFDRIRQRVDVEIVTTAPKAAQKVAAIQDNLASDNPEDWANAVHSCRRLLQEMADALFPATEPQERHGRQIKLGADNYINRLICYIDDKSASARFNEIVGSTLNYIGERLDAVFKAAQKGSHAEIASREEAERYVIYTFLTVSDVLSLSDASQVVSAEPQADDSGSALESSVSTTRS